jgi:hypothetical protein
MAELSGRGGRWGGLGARAEVSGSSCVDCAWEEVFCARGQGILHVRPKISSVHLFSTSGNPPKCTLCAGNQHFIPRRAKMARMLKML